MVSLGIDVSTSVAGICFSKKNELTNSFEIIDLDYIEISEFKTAKSKASAIIQKITSKNIPFNRIIIEEALLGFGGGKTRQQIIVMLIKFNAVFSYIIEEHFKIPVTHCNAMTMRKNVLGKACEKGTPSKAFVKQKVEEIFPEYKKWLAYDAKPKRGKKEVGELKVCEDMRDALICSFHGLKI